LSYEKLVAELQVSGIKPTRQYLCSEKCKTMLLEKYRDLKIYLHFAYTVKSLFFYFFTIVDLKF